VNPTEPAGHPLDRPELARLWDTARRRLERNGPVITSSRIELSLLDPEELDALCALLGQRRPAEPKLHIRLDQLDSALSDAGYGGLLGTLAAISGPIADRPAARAADLEARTALWSAAASHPANDIDGVSDWIDSLRRRGRITRLAADDPIQLLLDALDTIQRVAAPGSTGDDRAHPLPLLAASRFGDAHALDPDLPLGALVADGICRLAGTEDVRAAWQTFGIQLDQVNSSTLTYMLPGRPGSILAAAESRCQPLRITHRMLDSDLGLDLDDLDRVWVCENPTIVVLAADRLGPDCRPMICTDGMPAAVTSRLLAHLRSLGSELLVHADFDVGGMAIVNHLINRLDATPWRMTARDYTDALAGPTTQLTGATGSTPWDPELALGMQRHGRAVHEESIAPALIKVLSLSSANARHI
jgi:uncharacterized protein (TIGR02679 family)